jgi:methylphosphotriester-DNA--protein-cysteine methyltransferase
LRRNVTGNFRHKTALQIGQKQHKARGNDGGRKARVVGVRAVRGSEPAAAGYASASAFVAAFRRAFGVTPGALCRIGSIMFDRP